MRGWLRNLNRWMSAQQLVRNSILLISAEMVAKTLGLAVLYGGWRLKGVLGAQLLSAVAAAVLAFFILKRLAPPVAHRWGVT